ncbi:MAG: V-type ATPase 116kDa subunit family protein [Chlamydiota bacterium]|jgi:V/A-type H+-transporting ATPase subunit I
MIINVKKYLVFGSKDEIQKFFKDAQKAGFIEFIQKKPKSKEVSNNVSNLLNAIKVLKKQPVAEQATPLLDPLSLAVRINHDQTSLHQLEEEVRYIKSEIARITPFEDFPLEKVQALKEEANRIVQFLAMKSEKAKDTKLPPEVIYISSAYDLDYFIAINKDKKNYPNMIEMQIDQSISTLNYRLEYCYKKIQETEKQLKENAAYLPSLREELKKELNAQHLHDAKNGADYVMSSSLFSIQAWIPQNKIEAFKGLTKNLLVDFEEIKVEKKDRKPTYMENKGWSKVGEDLVHIYDTPDVSDKDPSTWILVFFAIFFAMIVSDAGYGLLYLALGLFIKFKFPNLKGMGKRFVKLILLLATCCIAWGTLTASFFGMDIGPENPFRKFSVLHFLAKEKTEYHMQQKDDVYYYWLGKFPNLKTAENGHEFMTKAVSYKEDKVEYESLTKFYDNILMEFSILMGVIHLILSFLRYLPRNWSGAGWILFMIGGYLYFPSQLNATTFVNFLHILDKPTAYLIGEYLVYAGIGLACVLSFIQRGFGAGLSELMNVVQVFADVLSYLRLYALALAGMIMGSTFNDIGISMGLGVGFIVIIIGHVVNIVLGIMGGVIHGLRLNFLEWYHYSFEGGGRRFSPLKLLK